jgi:acyl-ACP thioesterase
VFRVRFDEAGPDGLLRTSNLLRYAQDLASFHSDQLGFTRSWYAERGLVWLARAAEVAVLSPIRVGTVLTGTTTVLGSRRVWARRRTTFTDADRGTVAWTHVDWVLLDGRGAPVRIPADFEVAFGHPVADFGLARVTLADAPDTAARAVFRVRPQELDPMDHANNAVYADWLDEQVIVTGGDDGVSSTRSLPRLVRLEYVRAADRRTAISGWTWRQGDGSWACRLSDADGADLLRATLAAGLPSTDAV